VEANTIKARALSLVEKYVRDTLDGRIQFVLSQSKEVWKNIFSYLEINFDEALAGEMFGIMARIHNDIIKAILISIMIIKKSS